MIVSCILLIKKTHKCNIGKFEEFIENLYVNYEAWEIKKKYVVINNHKLSGVAKELHLLV